MLQIYNTTFHISHITYASIIHYHISHHILQTYKVMSHNVMLNYILSSDQNERYDMTSRYQMRRWHKCKMTVPHLPSSANVKKSEWKEVHLNKLWKENHFYGVCIFWIPSMWKFKHIHLPLWQKFDICKEILWTSPKNYLQKYHESSHFLLKFY